MNATCFVWTEAYNGPLITDLLALKVIPCRLRRNMSHHSHFNRLCLRCPKLSSHPTLVQQTLFVQSDKIPGSQLEQGRCTDPDFHLQQFRMPDMGRGCNPRNRYSGRDCQVDLEDQTASLMTEVSLVVFSFVTVSWAVLCALQV
jgi:hypothetical protein